MRRISAALAAITTTVITAPPLAATGSLASAIAPGAGSPATTIAARTASDVLVRANFDRLPLGRVSATEFNSQMHTHLRGESIFDDSQIVRRGEGKAYRVKLDAGSFKNYPAGNNGINAIVPLPRAVDNACIAYGLRFSEGFDWSLGGKLPGLGGVRPGISPATPTGGGNPGDKGWSGRMMWLGPKAYSWAGPDNQAVSYMYSPRMTSTYGDNVRWNRAFKAGEWHRFKQCYRMNTPGKKNGTLVAAVDGHVVFHNTSYTFRTRGDVRINHLYWAIFRGGGDRSWASNRTGYAFLDNVRISTRL